jgi:diaminopimelate decarboxylase
MINEDPISSSFLIYDQQEIHSKVTNWQKNLPWI